MPRPAAGGDAGARAPRRLGIGRERAGGTRVPGGEGPARRGRREGLARNGRMAGWDGGSPRDRCGLRLDGPASPHALRVARTRPRCAGGRRHATRFRGGRSRALQGRATRRDPESARRAGRGRGRRDGGSPVRRPPLRKAVTRAGGYGRIPGARRPGGLSRRALRPGHRHARCLRRPARRLRRFGGPPVSSRGRPRNPPWMRLFPSRRQRHRRASSWWIVPEAPSR